MGQGSAKPPKRHRTRRNPAGGNPGQRQSAPPQKPQAQTQSRHPMKDRRGRFITTRDGQQICYAFSGGERGECPEPCKNKRAHVCQKCLQPHRTAACTKEV